MQYMKVEWIHNFSDEPYLIYGELTSALEEIRKVEVFKDGRMGYASINGLEYLIFSSECNWSTKEEIESDPQFIVEQITKTEFEDIWERAVHQANQ